MSTQAKSTNHAPTASHTPGPWEWQPSTSDDWDNHGPMLISAPLNKPWREFWGLDGMERGKNHRNAPPSPTITSGSPWLSDADARLIAAAPDMLAALKALDKIGPKTTPPAHATIAARNWEIFQRARAAIAKAEGK